MLNKSYFLFDKFFQQDSFIEFIRRYKCKDIKLEKQPCPKSVVLTKKLFSKTLICSLLKTPLLITLNVLRVLKDKLISYLFMLKSFKCSIICSPWI